MPEQKARVRYGRPGPLVHMRRALTRGQCEVVLDFFRCLLIAEAYQRRRDIGEFMRLYRNYLRYVDRKGGAANGN